MPSQRDLSDPLTMRLPLDVLVEIEEIAAVCERSRSWVFVRALKSYLAAEGKEILDIAKARKEMAAGDAFDLDDVAAEVEAIVKGAAA
ncbi:CopG family transcriptional regulator [Pararhizobium polonicum]|uniref:CopG family transcriptional regulator n=2 Tax=Pararhizobium polonicum TaxID=1612624 RepID=A0A1C7P413_9HYPH|nr:ribbon-helix-helix protein, CopG family [Pararhizobium polonicum]OBZ95998.1 CopG family transcriptional regulator [Pararhizobium polonicum]